jgi:hypothetical protein
LLHILASSNHYRTFESTVLDKLFDWATKAYEASTNQQTLPHAIIALNCTDIRLPADQWTVERATANLLSAVETCLDPTNGNPKYRELARQFGQHTIEDLIHCYYSSFTVVRIPDNKDYPLLLNQVQLLYTTIYKRCQAVHFNKREARVALNSGDLNFYIQKAFDHFSLRLDRPFDFKKIDLQRNPIPHNLGGYILRLALLIKDTMPDKNANWIFDTMNIMVASCVFSDFIRYHTSTISLLG